MLRLDLHLLGTCRCKIGCLEVFGGLIHNFELVNPCCCPPILCAIVVLWPCGEVKTHFEINQATQPSHRELIILRFSLTNYLSPNVDSSHMFGM